MKRVKRQSPLLEPASKITTSRQCDHCYTTIHQVKWKQCKICHVFDLCELCCSDEKFDYANLSSICLHHHEQHHRNMSENEPITGDCLELLPIDEAERRGNEARKKIRERKYEVIREKKIQNDHEMFIVMERLKQTGNRSPITSEQTELNELNSLIAGYHLQASQRHIHVLSLDGGGVRGYMPIKVITQLVTQKYLSSIEQFDSNNSTHKEMFQTAQSQFTNRFDYFVGTSTGGLIAFCLAINYNILDLKELYSRSSYYFKRNFLGPYIRSKYNPSRIHRKIDEIINGIRLKDGTQLFAETATLLDIRNLLNPDKVIHKSAALHRHKTIDKNFTEASGNFYQNHNSCHDEKEKALLITAYNTKTNNVTVFNTSYARFWGYRIADVLKATMAAPTYFPPHEMWNMDNDSEQFERDDEPALYIDGGVFANDPELAALWAIRMEWKRPVRYHLLSIGTGCYNTELSSRTWGGYFAWILNKGFLINTLMDATRSFIETIASNLAMFDNMKRMKLNYRMTTPMDLDDSSFIDKFDEDWETLKTDDDFKAFLYFYEEYIIEKLN